MSDGRLFRSKENLLIAGMICVLLAAAFWAIVREGGLPALNASSGTAPGEVLGAEVISEEQYEALKADLSEEPFSPDALSFDGIRPPYYEAVSTVYIPQDGKSEEWQGILTAASGTGRVYLVRDDFLEDRAGAMRANHPFRLLVAEEDSISETSMVITGIPAVVLQADTVPEPGDKTEYEAEVSFFDPFRDNGHLYGVPCRYNIRGASTAGYAKSSYKLELRDGKGNQIKETMAGMRRDDDWILNSLYTDSSKIREKTAYAFWNELNRLDKVPLYAPDMEYVELFINDRYVGLYGLMPRIDRKLLNLQPGDYCYKITNPLRTNMFDGANTLTELRDEETAKERAAKLVYPEQPDGRQWNVLQSYFRFTQDELTEQDLKRQGIVFDDENAVDFSWFLTLVQGTDNDWVNMYVAARRQADGTYRLYQDVWDMNYSFGDVWADNAEGQTFAAESAADIENPYYLPYSDLYGRLLRSRSGEIRTLSLKKLTQWREAGLDASWIARYADECRDTLEGSGALAREGAKWDDLDGSGAEDLKQWTAVRFETVYGRAEEIMDRIAAEYAGQPDVP